MDRQAHAVTEYYISSEQRSHSGELIQQYHANVCNPVTMSSDVISQKLDST